jgi:hypothetical protein
MRFGLKFLELKKMRVSELIMELTRYLMDYGDQYVMDADFNDEIVLLLHSKGQINYCTLRFSD